MNLLEIGIFSSLHRSPRMARTTKSYCANTPYYPISESMIIGLPFLAGLFFESWPPNGSSAALTVDHHVTTHFATPSKTGRCFLFSYGMQPSDHTDFHGIF